MKKIFSLLIASCLLLSVAPVTAQTMPGSDMAIKAAQEMQASDPQAVQKFSGALQQGDIEGAKKIYLEFKRKQVGGAQSPDLTTPAASLQAPAPAAAPSIFEQTLSGHFPAREGRPTRLYIVSNVGESLLRIASDTALICRSGWSFGTRFSGETNVNIIPCLSSAPRMTSRIAG